ncbi:MAG: HAD-IA family hydrolase [Betaproteobacteria bacterium]
MSEGAACMAATASGADLTFQTGAGHPLAIDAVLFDLDGTLVDTAPDLAGALNRVRRERGLPDMPVHALRPYASAGARGMIGAGLQIAPDHAEYPALRDAFLAHYAAALCIDSVLFDAVPEVLAALEARRLRWGIVTNKATRFTTPLLAALALPSRPQVVVCGDTTPHAKPHPAPLVAAAAALGVDPARCVYVGDAERDVIAGLAAGMQTLVARYGYIEPGDRPEAWRAHGHLASPRELLAWLPASAR